MLGNDVLEAVYQNCEIHDSLVLNCLPPNWAEVSLIHFIVLNDKIYNSSVTIRY